LEGQALSGIRRRRIRAATKGDQKTRYDALRKELAKFDDIKPADLPEGISSDRYWPHGAADSYPRGLLGSAKDEVQPG
jgi:hypothetical protein